MKRAPILLALILLAGCYPPAVIPIVPPVAPPDPVNQRPVALMSYSHREPVTNELVVFNSAASRDPDGWIVSYVWVIGTRAPQTAPSVAVTFTAPGAVRVLLIVTDNDGATDTQRRTIIVTEPPPPATGGGCAGGTCG